MEIEEDKGDQEVRVVNEKWPISYEGIGKPVILKEATHTFQERNEMVKSLKTW